MVLLDDSSVQGYAREHSTRTRVRQHLGSELPISFAFGLAPDWTGSHGGVCTKLELTRQQILHTLVIHDQHDEVNIFAADLEAPTSAYYLEGAGALQPLLS